VAGWSDSDFLHRAVERLNPGMGNKYEKEKALELLEREASGKSIKVLLLVVKFAYLFVFCVSP